MRLLLLASLLHAVICQVYYYNRPPVVQQQNRVVPQQQRQVYYPVRTNCQNRCTNQNRYRWNYRPTGLSRPIATVNARPIVSRPNPVPALPAVPMTPPAPTFGGFTFTTPSTTSTRTDPSTTQTTTRPAPTTTRTTTETATESTSTLPTPEPETPPPSSPPTFTTVQEATSHESTVPSTEATPTTRYMRPERKQNKQRFFNPCPTGRALSNEFDTPLTCNHLNKPNGGCPEDYWCHTGASFATTACCPRDTSEADRCEMRRDTGEGAELVARWYFDRQAKICKRFLYKGIRGNANNFITKMQCIDACETAASVDSTNPCRSSQPGRHRNGTRIVCGPNDSSMCPPSFYCHVGENPEYTTCCEDSGLTDPCLLALNVGQGKALLKRFYYNTFSKRCTEFVYKGTKGNENNFLSSKQCQDTCQKWTNPCPSPLNVAQRRECSVNGTECTGSTWCHVGASEETTVCCPGVSPDPCSQGMETGEGGANLTRWWADPSDKSCNRQCQPFVYGGLKGNQNNFPSKGLCEQKCKRECRSPCGSGSMLLSSRAEPRLCSPSSPCPQSHWCHVGITPDTTVCCSAVPNTCELPMEKGYGVSHLTRWHFDKNTKKCIKFIYTGEGGNQNMFLTQDDCVAVCPVYENPCGTGKPLLVGSLPKTCSPSERCPSTHFCHIGASESGNVCCPKNGDPCDQELSSGTGGMALTRFYFDKDTRRCREFSYQGGKGNANNFLSLPDCESVCPVLPNPCRLGEPLMSSLKEPVICGGEDACDGGFWCHVGATPETTNCCPGTRRPCDLPLEMGEGGHSLDRWFYDGGIQMCRPFIYKGMKGNSNNFLTKQACRQACKELNPCGYGQPHQDETGERMQCTGGQKVDSCPRGFYCHVGGSAVNTVCCPRRNVDSCDQPVEQGNGGDDLPRWFFDKRQNRCAPFTYGGVGGNENNFISQNTCSSTCPEYRNYCPHGIPLIEEEQVTSCGIDRGCPDGFICHMSSEFNVSICCQDPMDFCLSPRDPGPCNHNETRYGYNAATDTCIEYNYGGCEGSLNNFHSLQRCTEICCKEYKRKH